MASVASASEQFKTTHKSQFTNSLLSLKIMVLAHQRSSSSSSTSEPSEDLGEHKSALRDKWNGSIPVKRANVSLKLNNKANTTKLDKAPSASETLLNRVLAFETLRLNMCRNLYRCYICKPLHITEVEGEVEGGVSGDLGWKGLNDFEVSVCTALSSAIKPASSIITKSNKKKSKKKKKNETNDNENTLALSPVDKSTQIKEFLKMKKTLLNHKKEVDLYNVVCMDLIGCYHDINSLSSTNTTETTGMERRGEDEGGRITNILFGSPSTAQKNGGNVENVDGGSSEVDETVNVIDAYVNVLTPGVHL